MPLQLGVDTATAVAVAIAFAAVAAFLWWIHRHTMTDMSAPRKRWALGIRLTIVLCLFLSLAGLRWVRSNNTLTVAYVVDASASMSDQQKGAALRFIREATAHKRQGDRVAALTFGLAPDIKALPGDKLGLEAIHHSGPTTATDIAQAIDAALSIVPRTSAAKIVVLSDGNENVGSALAEVPTVTARGARVETVVLPSSLRREALIDKLIVPGQVKIGEPFVVRTVVSALNAQPARLLLLRDGKVIATRAVSLTQGKQSVDFDMHIDQAGFARFEALLQTDPRYDTITENNRGLGFVTVRGRPTILYAASSPRIMSYIQGAMKRQNIDVRYCRPEALPTSPIALQQYDSIILSDVPRDLLSDAQMETIRTATRDFGVGFAMIGGENSFGLGGYRKTPIEDILPVSMDIRKMQRFPPITVALVIDRSGSMEGPKLEMAKEAAARAIQSMKPTDRVTVVTFTFGAELQVPLTPIEKSADIIQGIQQIGGGGGTSVFSGLEKGFEQIRNDPAAIKHIIVLTDGQSNDPDYKPLVAELKKRRITVSTVGIGTTGEVNAPLLAWLAMSTGGRFYQVNNPHDIPRIYVQEIERVSSKPIVEEPFVPSVSQDAAERMPSVPWSAVPPLLGYNVTELKPTADQLMMSHKKNPILATWRFGLGRTLAFTSDDRNRWAAHWLPWNGYSQFWAQNIRWTMRSLAQSDFQTAVVQEGSRGHITVDAIDRSGKFVNRLLMNARVVSPDAAERGAQNLKLRQIGPGHYEAWFDAARIGTYLVNILRKRQDGITESSVTGLVVPYSPEFRDVAANEFLMTQLAQTGSGSVLTRPDQVFRANRPVLYTPSDLLEWLLLIAMLLLPVDVAVRRIALEREDLARAWSWVAARLPFARVHIRRGARAKPATPELGRLMKAKRRSAPKPTQPAATASKPDTSSAATPGIPAPVIQPSPVQAQKAELPAAEAPEQAETASSPASSHDAMSRLLAAKRRARR